LEDETLEVLFFATGVLLFLVTVDLAALALVLDELALGLDISLFLADTFGLEADFLVDAL
jgi:membrane protein CcdC involved in cytochrome C biogenesis